MGAGVQGDEVGGALTEVFMEDVKDEDVSLARALRHAAVKALMKLVSDGTWLQPNYAARIVVPQEILTDIWKMVDVEKVKAELRDRIHAELADRVVNAMAAEISTDVKQILSVKERREAIRSLVRAHLDDIMAGKSVSP